MKWFLIKSQVNQKFSQQKIDKDTSNQQKTPTDSI